MGWEDTELKSLRNIFAASLCLIALAAAGTGMCLALANRQAEPMLVREDPRARATVQALLDAVSSGNYTKAGSLMLGAPELGIDRPAEDELGVLLWDAYQENLTFTPVGDCYATASGIAYDYTVRRLDLDSVTANLNARSQALLSQWVEQAEDMDQVYDENNEYRKSFVMKVLMEAANQALVEDATYMEQIFTVNMVHRNGKWFAIPDSGLMDAISCSLAK